MYHPCGCNKYSHHSKLTKTKFYHQPLWNAIIYCCYCIIFVDLLCIFEFTMYFWIFLLFCIQKIAVLSKFHSVEFVTIHALTLQFNSTPRFSMVQRCSVVFNKPNENVVACQLCCANEFKLQSTINQHGLNRS